MELDHFLHKIQGVLKSQERVIGTLTTVKKDDKGVSKVLRALEKVVGDEEFDSEAKRKLFILLFLNTNTDIYKDVKKTRKCAHLVGFFPKISTDLFMTIVFDLKLQQYLYESVQSFPTPLSCSVLDICVSALSWIDLFEAVSFVENLLTSLFFKMVTVDANNKWAVQLKLLFQRFLIHYHAEKGDIKRRMSLWKASKLKHYAGLVMASLLSLLQNCTEFYCKTGEDKAKMKVDSVFNIQVDEESFNVNFVAGSDKEPLTVQQCYEHVVSNCIENLTSVTVDIWLFWVEIDLDDIPDTENNLQRLIGEKAYTCREVLLESECLGVSCKETSDLTTRLKSLSIKPHTEEDNIASFDLDKILDNIQDPSKDTRRWLKFLLKNTTFAVDPKALQMFKTHIMVLDDLDITKLTNLLFAHIKLNTNCTAQKEFVLDIIKFVDIDCQFQISKCFVDHFQLSEILKTDEFQPMFVETFNKLINEEVKEKELYPQLMSLALQSPQQVVSRAVAEGITSEVRGHLMADILGRLQPFCDVAPPLAGPLPLLLAALDKLLMELPQVPDNHRTNFPLFVRELVMRKTLNGIQFIRECLMVKLHHNLKSKNFLVLSSCLDTLSELFDGGIMTSHCSASLMMLLQVVQTCRWSPASFTLAAVDVCETALQLVSQLVTRWFSAAGEEKQLINLKSLVQKCVSEENRYHLARLLSDEPLPPDPGLQLVYRMHYGIGDWSVLQLTADDRLKLIYSLCFVLPVLTRNEWQEMFCVTAPKCSEFLALFHIVTDSLLLCLDSAKMMKDPNVINCLDFAVLNVAEAVKAELVRWTKDDNEYRISVLSKLCQLVSGLPSEQQGTLVKVLQQLLPEGSRRRPLSDVEMSRVTAAIASLPAPALRQRLSKEFLDMVHR